ENAALDASWRFSTDHVVTNVPDGLSGVALPPGFCVDFVPILGGGWCVRPYGFDDSFSGDWRTARWMGTTVGEFLAASGIHQDAVEVPDDADVFDAPLFPVAASMGELHEWLRWFAAEPMDRRASSARWVSARRLSGRDLLRSADLGEIEALRSRRLVRSLGRMIERRRTSVFLNMDLEATAALLAEAPEPVPEVAFEEDPPAHRMAASMFRAEYLRRSGDPRWNDFADGAFAALRELIVRDEALGGLEPRLATLPDQIVWARSPLRLDFAGGWSDTPPYCLLHGGRVLNVAVDLNGQPPVQVFARRTDHPCIVLRSIDLGVEERIEEFDALERYDEPGSSFSLAKAALTLAGFGRRFAARPARTLRDRLLDAGGGLELSLLAAVPKGSGLGTSSILAATLLATISDVAGLGWSKDEVIRRTLALEQLLTTGGGWQDQAGGCLPGLKVLETHPGLDQTPSCRWLADRMLEDACAEGTALLYYTGITRLAKSVLGEIVRGMFLNSGPKLRTIRAIVENVDPVSDAIQRKDWRAFGLGISRSWLLNRELDSGTSTPEIDGILSAVEDLIHGAKLLGAGGGGFLFLVAKDPEAGRRIRSILGQKPPSPRARFVAVRVSQVGLEVTRS
ncbi:MAG: bifunctional fucokinase/L-fucose-1-P-guanylyltransferase, partial [Fimbriimonadaceae bacterium]